LVVLDAFHADNFPNAEKTATQMLEIPHFVLTEPTGKCCFSSTMKTRLVRWLAACLALAGLHSCTAPGGYRSGEPVDNLVTGGLRSGDAALAREAVDQLLSRPTERPGLATGWGREKKSQLTSYRFERSGTEPAGTDVIYYNDRRGIESMVGKPRKVEPLQTVAGGLVEWGVKSRGSYLPTYLEAPNGRRLVEGRPGASYVMVVRNRSKSILEIVASVDGLDVFDGKPASFAKRGYLVEPGETLEIEGFRMSWDKVAAFQFSSVASSYANLRHGDTRNVGVLGIAVFTQKGVNPWRNAEVERRIGARAFAEAP
jgi:hypothetical protein